MVYLEEKVEEEEEEELEREPDLEEIEQTFLVEPFLPPTAEEPIGLPNNEVLLAVFTSLAHPPLLSTFFPFSSSSYHYCHVCVCVCVCVCM